MPTTLPLAFLLDCADRFVERRLAARDDRDIGAGGGKALCDGMADALAAAGNDCRTA
jgi:hypothetical protein